MKISQAVKIVRNISISRLPGASEVGTPVSIDFSKIFSIGDTLTASASVDVIEAPETSAVPEPASFGLMAAGVVLAAFLRRRRGLQHFFATS